jgi:hypothetical protein
MGMTALTQAPGAIVSTVFGLGAGGNVFRKAMEGNRFFKHILRRLPSEKNDSIFTNEALGYRAKLAKYNVTGTDVHVNQMREIRSALKSAGIADPIMGYVFPGAVPGTLTRKLKHGIAGFDNAATEFYQAGDDYWKSVMFFGQLEKLSNAFDLLAPRAGKLLGLPLSPKELFAQIGDVDANGQYSGPMTEAQADAILKEFPPTTPDQQKILADNGKQAAAIEMLQRAASSNVNATMPNYANATEFVRWLKRNGVTALAAPYISFRAEIARIALSSTPRLAWKEMRSDNEKIKRMGAARMASWAFTMTAAPATMAMVAQMGYAALKALGDDEEEGEGLSFGVRMADQFKLTRDVKRFISKYYKDGTIAVLDVDEEKGVTWMDLSYMMPHAVVQDPLQMMFRIPGQMARGEADAKEAMSVMQRGFMKFMAPYASPQLWVSALVDANENTDSVLNDIDPNPFWRGVKNFGFQLAEVSTPGTLVDGQKILEAAMKGENFQRGRRITAGQELVANLLGTKLITTDIGFRFEQKMKYRNAQFNAADLEFKSLIRSRTTMSNKEVEKAWDLLQDRRRRIALAGYQDFVSATQLLKPGRTAELLSSNKGLDRNMKKFISEGKYEYWTPSRLDIQVAKEQSEFIKNPGRVDVLGMLFRRDKGKVVTFDPESPEEDLSDIPVADEDDFKDVDALRIEDSRPERVQ